MPLKKVLNNMFSSLKCKGEKQMSLNSLPKLDDAMWGMRRKELTVVGARPSQGKSSFIGQLTLDLLMQDKNVVVFSWEAVEEGFMRRMFCNYCRLDNLQAREGGFTKRADAKILEEEFKRKIENRNLSIINKRGRTLNDFERLLMKFNHIDCVIVDYLQLINKMGFAGDREAYNAFMQRARELAEELNCAMIIVSQVGRPRDGKRPGEVPLMDDLKGSGVIEEHSDLIILLHWDWFYTRREEDFHRYTIKLAKQRDGMTGIFNVWFYPQYYKFSETPMEGEHCEFKT